MAVLVYMSLMLSSKGMRGEWTGRFPRAPHLVKGFSWVSLWPPESPLTLHWHSPQSLWGPTRASGASRRAFRRKTEHHLGYFPSLHCASPRHMKSHEHQGGKTAPHPTHIEYLNKNALLIFRDASVSDTWKLPSKYLKKTQSLASLMNFFFF